MQRGFSAILILFSALLVLLVIGVFFISDRRISNGSLARVIEKQSTAANVLDSWTKYASPGGEFEFKFPSEVVVKEDTEADFFKRANGNARENFASYVGYGPAEVTQALAVVEKTNPNIDSAPFTVWVFNNPQNLNEKTWFDKYWYYPFNWGIFEMAEKEKISPSSTASVSGQAARFGVINYSSGKPKYVYLGSGGKMFLFQIKTDSAVGEQILATFHLMKVSVAADEKARIDLWISTNSLNQYGDRSDIAYTGGTPLFNEATGKTTDRYDYIVSKHPDRPWNK